MLTIVDFYCPVDGAVKVVESRHTDGLAHGRHRAPRPGQPAGVAGSNRTDSEAFVRCLRFSSITAFLLKAYVPYKEAETGVWVQAWQRSPDARGLLPGSRWSLRTDRDDGTASKPGSDEGDRRCGGKPWLRLHARHRRGVKHKVQIRERVNLFLEQLPPESRRRLRLALRRMESENADRLALRERLTGYSRLRDGNFRSLSRYVPGRVIESVFAHERSLVYALFEREFLEHLRHEAQGQVPSRRRPH